MTKQAAPRCLTCAHWVQSEAPAWAQAMGMAVCAKRNTKSITVANWRSCGKHQRAEKDQVQRRVVWLKSVGAQTEPAQPPNRYSQPKTPGG